ncbi:MAG: signal recognition particle-docking protein FtsY [Methanomicrobiales archaeon]|jgi:fused signal recognition particle receptor|nr:signal recognition particle-docking protein FtsY [Methanomicrobiales archaeon]
MFKGLKERLKAVKDNLGFHVEEIADQQDLGISTRDTLSAPDLASVSTKSIDRKNIFSGADQKNKGAALDAKEGVDDDESLIHESPSPVPLSFDIDEDEALEKKELPSKAESGAKVGIGSKIKAFVVSREFIIDQKQIDVPLFDLEMALLENDVALSAVDEIISSIRTDLTGSSRKMGTSVDDVITNSLKNAMLRVLGERFDLLAFIAEREKPVKIIFVGVNGTGKTTSIAKLASYLTKQGLSVVIGAGDTFRAGAIEQIDVHAKRLGLKVVQHQEGSDPTAVLYDTTEYARAHHIDVVLGDTAGRFHNRVNLMNQLEKIRRVIQPDLIIYVDEAVAGNDAVVRAEEFERSVGLDGVILTKVDMDPRGGAALSIAHAVGKPLIFIGVGQGYDDLIPFSPEQVVEDLLGEEAEVL